MHTACVGVALFAVTVMAATTEQPHPLATLADHTAAELMRIAAGRAIQVDVPEDETGMAVAALDLQFLIDARLRGRAVVARSGPRVRLSSALGRSATRLRLVGRVTAEPGGALVDVVAMSAEVDPDVLDLVARTRPPRGTVAVVASHVSAPIGARVLDLAFVDDDRLVALLEDGVALFQREGAVLLRIDHRPLAVSLAVRAPAGIVVAAVGESAFWVSTNMAESAILFTIDGGRLHETEHAAALPWPGSPQGARFRPGTNLIDVTVAGLGSGPHLRAGAADTPWAIAPDGRLGAGAGWSTTRVGSAAALLWTDTWIASSAEAPGPGDALSVVSLRAGAPAVVATFPVPGSVTAIGARTRGEHVYVAAAAVEGGLHRLILMEIVRDGP